MKIHSFDSLSDFTGFFARDVLPEIEPLFSSTHEYAVSGGLGLPAKQSLNILDGIESYSKHEVAINKIIEEMREQGLFSNGMPEPQTHYIGHRPNIGAYLKGLPKNMVRRVPGEKSAINAPIRVYVDVAVSSGVNPQQIENRGIALCAFTIAMNIIRPVELHICNIGMNSDDTVKTGYMCKVSEGRIDTARMMFALCESSYARRLSFPANSKLNNLDIRYPYRSYPMQERHVATMRGKLNLGPNDLFFYGLHLHSALPLNDPMTWVKQMVKKHRLLQE